MPTLNGPMWSISYEFKCYLLVLVLGLLGWHEQRRLWLALTLACIALHLAINLHLVTGMRGRVPDVRCLMLFLVGGCYHLYAHALPYRAALGWGAVIGLLIGLNVAAVAEVVAAICLGYLLCVVGQHAGGPLLAFNRWPDVSYGMYLYGWPINKMVLWWGPAQLSAALALTLGLTLLVAWCSWVLIEAPALKLKR